MNINLINTELEEKLATWCIKNERKDVFAMCRKFLSYDDFSDTNCSRAWTVQQIMYSEGRDFSMDTFNTYANDASLTKWMMLSEDASPTADIVFYAETIAALSIKRKFDETITKVQMQLDDPNTTIDECTQMMRDAIDSVHGKEGGIERLSEVLTKVLGETEKIKNGQFDEVVNTGFKYIDNAGGLKVGDLNIIAGRTSNGKTAFATAIALTAAKNVPVAFYSMEMTNEQIAKRIASMESLVPIKSIEKWPISDKTFKQFQDGVEEASKAKIIFDKYRNSSLSYILNSIRTMVSDYGVRVVVVDYLQQLTGAGYRDKRSLLSDACVMLKNLAVELKITIIALSQLARTNDKNNIPLMNQLKECGEIENSADNVYMVYRAELYGEQYPDKYADRTTEGTALIINSKSRSSYIGDFIVKFNSECTLYYDADIDDIEKVEPTDTQFMAKDKKDLPF